MNKIYRRLWSTARQCWVVASELSAARGKSSQLVGAGVLALALTLSSSGACAAEDDPVDEPEDIPVLDAWALQAAFGSRAAISGAGAAPFGDVLAEPVMRQLALTTDHYYRDSTVDGDLLTVLGSRSTLSGSRSVAYGSVITSRGTNNTAIGYNVQITNGGYATAVGAESVASGVGTTVLGNNAKAYSENSIAVGSGANTVNSSAGVSRIAIGGNAYAGTAGWSGAVALGGNSRAEYDAVAVGHEARSTAEGALAMGRGAQATAANALAMGKGAKAQTASSLAVGRDAQTAATGSIAIGQGARITDAFAQDSIAIGRGANTQHLSSIALGSGSVTTGNWQVAVGSSSRKRRIVGVEDAYLARSSDHAVTGGQLYVTNENVTRAQRTADEAAAGARLVTQSSPSSAIRMGAENTGTVIDVANAGGTKRRIQNIANGVLSAGSTDAVTGQQLHATNQTVSTATSTANAAKASADAAVARISAAAVALGQAAVAEGSGSTASAALGSAAKAYNGSGVAMGADARAGVNDKGEKSTAATGAVAIGALSRSGNGAVATGLRASAIGDRAVALGNDASAAATHATATGYKATASAGQATAIGREASASGTFSTALGNLASARAESAVALGDRAVAAHTGSVALGNGSQTTAGNQISVGNGTLKRKIVNVADGALNTSSAEAVTGKQLNATNVEVASVRTTAASAQTTAGAAKTAADDALAKANALGGLVGQTSATGNVRLGGENTGTVLDVRNKSNANRKLTGVADATLSTSSTEAVSGKQLNATNVEVASVRNTATSAQTTANTAKTTADNALAKADVLGGLVGQVSATGNVRLGGENTGTVLDVRNKSNASRKLTGVADATLSTSSTEAVSGKQLNATNVEVASVRNTATSAQTTANTAKTTADNALAKADVLGGLVGQVSATGNVRLGGENTGTVLDVRNKSNASRKVTGVADATLSTSSTEAVTGRQLFGVDQKVTANQSLLASHATELTGHEARIAGNRRDLDDLRTEFDNFDPDLEGVVRYAADGSIDMDGGKVRGVAAGDISSAGSTDAVNGGQLFATNQRLEGIEQDKAFIAIYWDEESASARAGWLGVAIGSNAHADGSGATAVGAYSQARATNAVAIGRGARVLADADYGFALGSGSEVAALHGVAVGSAAQVVADAEGAVAIGATSIARESYTFSVGNDSLKRRIVNVGRGIKKDDAVNVSQVGEVLSALGGGAAMDGAGTIIAPSYNVQGETFNTVGDALTSLDGAVVTAATRVDRVESQLRSVFQESPATRSDGLNQLNLAGANGMVLGNVANGLIAPGSRDAVNGGQLYAAEQKIERNRSDLEELRNKPRTQALVAPVGAEISRDIDFGGARLVGVADGRIADKSTDAVNGSQLHSTNSRLLDIEAERRYLAVWADGESEAARVGKMGVAIGDGSFTSSASEGGTAIGSYTSAQADDSVALGRGANVGTSGTRGLAALVGSNVYATDGIALGAYSRVEAGATGSLALGYSSIAREEGVVSFGHSNLQRRLTNIAGGRDPNDATTVSQLNRAVSLLGAGAGVDANGNIVGPTFNVQGGSQHTLGDALNALDGAVITAGSRVDRVESQLRSVFQESPATRSDGLNQLNLAGANGMVLGNVANGLIAPGSRDAVNGGQLHAMEQRLDGRIDGLEQRVDATPEGRALASASAPTPPAAPEAEGPAGASGDPAAASAGRAGGGIASADGGGTPAPADAPAPTPQVNTADLEKMLARANEYTDGAISNFERRLDKMDKRFNRMAAMSSAQSAMAMNTAGLATYNRLGAGVGYSDGETALAVGYQRVLNERGSATFSLNGAFTNSGEQSVGLGVGIGW